MSNRKVFWVEANHYDGGHEHGIWRSPIFSTREKAEEFEKLAKVIWWTDDWATMDRVTTRIVEEQVLDSPGDDVDVARIMWQYHDEFGDVNSVTRLIEQRFLTITYT